MSIQKSLANIRQYIRTEAERYGRSAREIQLLAVSKKQSVDKIREAITAGQTDFGESYVQEALNKIQAINDDTLCWHFIGPIQSNKTQKIADHFDWVHSLDRIKIARRLNEQRHADKPRLNVCIQVNISQETSKSGVAPDELALLAKSIISLPRLHLRGLMAMPAPGTDFSLQRLAFAQTRQLLINLNKQGFKLDTLSMGTSSDLAAAIAEGATLVRPGSAIFGNRT